MISGFKLAMGSSTSSCCCRKTKQMSFQFLLLLIGHWTSASADFRGSNFQSHHRIASVSLARSRVNGVTSVPRSRPYPSQSRIVAEKIAVGNDCSKQASNVTLARTQSTARLGVVFQHRKLKSDPFRRSLSCLLAPNAIRLASGPKTTG